MWVIRNRSSGNRLSETSYETEQAASAAISRLGSAFAPMFEAYYISGNVTIRRMINEGIVRGDLESILLPKISVDEYVPSDPDTDHIVLAFYLKGVPEAVYPFKNFCEKSDGVILADYGDSDTIPQASIVYVEFDRDNFQPDKIDNLVSQVALTCNLEPEDFSLAFPNSNKTFPYHIKVLIGYFDARDREDNLLAQKQAIQQRTTDLQDEIEKEINQGQSGEMLKQTTPMAPKGFGQLPPQPEKTSGSGSSNANARNILTGTQKATIRTLSKNGMPNEEIAKRVGVSVSTVNRYAESIEPTLTREQLTEVLVTLF